jgi:hypothetical protein
MEEIELFIKKNSIDKIKKSITFKDNYICYKYKYLDYLLIFNEYTDDNNKNSIELIYNKNIYKNFIDIQLILFDIFNYKNIEYIDVYIQYKIKNKKIILTDLYNDYYDDIENKLICIRRLYLNEEEIIKLKFVIEDYDITLYYKDEVINNFENIIEKINNLIDNY